MRATPRRPTRAWRAEKRREAHRLLEQALAELVGLPDGDRLAWFNPVGTN